jgi:hypothetical protein
MRIRLLSGKVTDSVWYGKLKEEHEISQDVGTFGGGRLSMADHQRIVLFMIVLETKEPAQWLEAAQVELCYFLAGPNRIGGHFWGI